MGLCLGDKHLSIFLLLCDSLVLSLLPSPTGSRHEPSITRQSHFTLDRSIVARGGRPRPSTTNPQQLEIKTFNLPRTKAPQENADVQLYFRVVYRQPEVDRFRFQMPAGDRFIQPRAVLTRRFSFFRIPGPLS